jgi:hypothetical protein
LDIGHQAGSEQNSPHLGTITEFENGGNGIDEDCGVQLIHMMVIGIIELTQVKAEVQGKRHHDKETEDNFFRIHRQLFLFYAGGELLSLRRPGN